MNRADSAREGAAFEDWSEFEPDRAMISVARSAAVSWDKVADYLETLLPQAETGDAPPPLTLAEVQGALTGAEHALAEFDRWSRGLAYMVEEGLPPMTSEEASRLFKRADRALQKFHAVWEALAKLINMTDAA